MITHAAPLTLAIQQAMLIDFQKVAEPKTERQAGSFLSEDFLRQIFEMCQSMQKAGQPISVAAIRESGLTKLSQNRMRVYMTELSNRNLIVKAERRGKGGMLFYKVAKRAKWEDKQ